MRYRVLGTTQASHDDGTPVALGGARLRALLTAFALRPGRTIPVGVLVTAVWDGDPPADATGALQALVGRLRRTLGHPAVSSSEGGYRLCADEEDVDIHRFGRLAAEGAGALEAGDPVKAAALLDDALALWRGPALADLPDGGPEAARWEARRLDARRARLTAALALGGAAGILPELAALCEEFPLDEPLQALRVRALHEASRTAEALAAYESVRRGIADRLGTGPGAELRSLHQELLRADPREPAWDAGRDAASAGRRDPAGNPSGRQVPGARKASVRQPPQGNLRARLTSFVGRERDIAAIRDDLRRARLVTLLGPGGAGKTRLSQEAAEGAERAAGAGDGEQIWPDGIWLAELAPVDDPATVPEAVLTALGGRETVLRGAGAEELRGADSSEPLARLTEHCARRRMLLLLDNCEHVVEAAAELAEELLARCPELTVLATSREPLGVPGEVVRPVESLPPDPAHRLFAERARAVRPGFDPAEEPEAVAEICRRLDGLPLAIELAAARLRLLTPRQIVDRLDDRFRLLTTGSRTVLPRQQTLRAVIDWSWDLLDAPERAVLRRLSVFAGGCDLTAAEAVCADDPRAEGAGQQGSPGVESRDVAALLGSLIDKSLVVAAPSTGGEMRYRLLETVGEYAAERLDEAGDRAGSEHRHLVHYRELARTVDPVLRGPGQRDALTRLQLEYENLRTALRRATAAGDEQEAFVLVLSLAWFWQMLDLRSEARHWSAVAAALGPDPFTPSAEAAPPLTRRCTDAPPPMTPDLLMEARREVRLIEMATMDHDMDLWASPERAEWLNTVATVYRPGLPQTCRFPGTLALFSVIFTGDEPRLRRVMDENVRACEDFGLDWELAAALQMRANIKANRSIWAGEAAADADRSLAIFERLGDAWGTAEALSARGEAREKRGEYLLAAADYQAAVGYAEGLGAQSQAVLLRSRYAATLFETERGAEGERILRELLAEGRDTAREALLASRLFLALWLGRTGRVTEAREQLRTLRETLRSDTLVIFEGFAKGAFAWLDCLEGRFTEGLASARAGLRSAMSPLSQLIAPEMMAMHLPAAAWALAGLAEADPERARDAARLLGAYETLLPPGHVRNAAERDLLAGARGAVVALLGEETCTAVCAEGALLTLEDAVALV